MVEITEVVIYTPHLGSCHFVDFEWMVLTDGSLSDASRWQVIEAKKETNRCAPFSACTAMAQEPRKL